MGQAEATPHSGEHVGGHYKDRGLTEFTFSRVLEVSNLITEPGDGSAVKGGVAAMASPGHTLSGPRATTRTHQCHSLPLTLGLSSRTLSPWQREEILKDPRTVSY